MSSHSDGQTLRLFDEATMSGVPPGAHAARYQRIRMAERHDSSQRHWFMLTWHTNPDRVLAFDEISPGRDKTPVFEVTASSGTAFLTQFLNATADLHQQAQTCGTCSFWRMDDRTHDALPLGRCTWHDTDQSTMDVATQPEDGTILLAIESQLTLQSSLALNCTAWAERSHLTLPVPSTTPPEPETLGDTPEKKSAPREPSLVQRVTQWFLRGRSDTSDAADKGEPLLEQSGVGAGTESCPVCHGRIANLGSMLVTAPEGDAETLSIWRCRNCYTLYLNDWIDRWVRVASLTTEEFLYRVSPAQAARILYLFRPERFGAKVKRELSAAERRDAILHVVRDLPPVVYQSKQGR